MDQATRDKINELRNEVDPQWAYERRKEYLKDIITDLIVDYWVERDRLSDYVSRNKMMETILVQVRMQAIIKHILKHQNELYYRRLAMSGKNVGVTADEIKRAKEYPFEELLPVVKGKVACPFHEDKHPSASIKDNKLHCFVCNVTVDTIEFVMKKDGVSFGEAVRSLS